MSKDKMTFSKVILMAGSNDCSCSDSTTQSIMQDMTEAVTEAKKVSSEVCISSIIPRTDDGSAQLKAENVNLEFKQYADQSLDVSFLDNDKTFRLADKSPNDGYLIDGHHLSYSGSYKEI